jgi:hypothetical protein
MAQAAPAPSGDARFGEAPLAQTVAAAGAMRRLGSLLVSLEHAHPTVDAMIAKFGEWENELTAVAPRDSAPRIDSVPDDHRRIYLNHATGMLIGYIPDAQLGYVTDLWAPGTPLPDKINPGLAAVVNTMKKAGVQPVRFVGGHGPGPGDYAPLAKLSGN